MVGSAKTLFLLILQGSSKYATFIITVASEAEYLLRELLFYVATAIITVGF